MTTIRKYLTKILYYQLQGRGNSFDFIKKNNKGDYITITIPKDKAHNDTKWLETYIQKGTAKINTNLPQITIGHQRINVMNQKPKTYTEDYTRQMLKLKPLI